MTYTRMSSQRSAFEATNATEDQEIIDELIARGCDRLRAELLAEYRASPVNSDVIRSLLTGDSNYEANTLSLSDG